MDFNFIGTIWSLLPPVVAIALALKTKEVYSSLFIGIVLGAILYSMSMGTGFEGFLTHLLNDTVGTGADAKQYGLISCLSDPWNVGIIVFLVVLGSIVSLMNKAGGSAAFGRWASKHIKTKIGAQISTIILGLLIFIDDYFNCLTVVIGPAIILIGLSLSGSAVDMAKTNWILAFASLITAILVLNFCKGLMKLVPIISGVIVGYVIAICMGEVDFSGVAAASWFSCPVSFDTITHFSWAPFLYMLPVAIAPVLEHIGDVYVVSAVAKKDFVADPGLHRTMLGDGLACLCSAFLGGPPETTYSEVTGAMSITKVTSPAVIRISAATAICFSIVGKLSALLQSIPQAVLGGIMLLLFGTIASVGVQNLMQNKVDMNETRNVIIISVMLTMGLGGAVLSSGSFAISGIGLSAVIGVVLNLVLPKTKKKEA